MWVKALRKSTASTGSSPKPAIEPSISRLQVAHATPEPWRRPLHFTAYWSERSRICPYRILTNTLPKSHLVPSHWWRQLLSSINLRNLRGKKKPVKGYLWSVIAAASEYFRIVAAVEQMHFLHCTDSRSLKTPIDSDFKALPFNLDFLILNCYCLLQRPFAPPFLNLYACTPAAPGVVAPV